MKLISLKHLDIKISLSILFSVGIVNFENHAWAQSFIVSDDTLGLEQSQVVENFQGLPIEIISGGAIRGQNLFHSFSEFNVSEDRGAYFFSPNQNIANILTRVAGDRSSKILGTIGTFGASQPDLYLLNPNGILFGPEAALDLGSAFIATTADAIHLGSESIFSTLPSQNDPLLSINPSAFIFNQQKPAPIVNLASGNFPVLGFFLNAGRTFSPQGFTGGLEAVDNQNIVFLGGDISFLNNGTASVSGGHISIASLNDAGVADILNQDGKFSLRIPENQELGAIHIADRALIDVTGNGGSINLQARDIFISNQGAVISDTFGEKSGQGVFIQADNSLVIDDGIISSSVLSSEDTGADIRINANEVNISGETLGIVATTTFDRGNAGNTLINANNLSLQGGGQIIASTFGSGNAGNIYVSVEGNLEISGESASGAASGLATNTRSGIADAGDIILRVNTLEISDGAEVSTDAPRGGDGGDLIINAAESVRLLSDGRLILKTGADGDAGNLFVTTQRLLIDDSEATTSTEGSGRAGDIFVNASESVKIDRGGLVSFSILASGDTGSIILQTPNLRLLERGRISTESIGFGVAGDIKIFVADSIEVGKNSSIDTNATTIGGIGQVAGNLLIETSRLLVQNGGRIATETAFGSGNGGTLKIIATDSVDIISSDDLDASRISSRTRSDGSAGQLEIQTPELTVQDNAIITAGTTGQGSGSTVLIMIKDLNILEGASISTVSEGSGSAGDIIIDATNRISLVNGNLLTEAPFSSGGDILVNTSPRDNSGLITLMGDSDILTNSSGDGGNITLGSIIVALDDSDILARSQDANGGNISLGVFFSATLLPENQEPFDGNERVDVNADGQLAAGAITTPDTSFIQNSLSELPEIPINSETLVASSCIIRGQETGGTFIITGNTIASTPNSPSATYSTGVVQIPNVNAIQSTAQTAIVEPTSIYQTTNGRLIMSKEC
ncbi:MAG: filamentous hemagglutinin N-terminal domain-containing protein [Cyanobacteria bacterium P01_B01_bin.77]